MIIKSWKFKGFNSEMPSWVQEETSKRAGNQDLWVHTQRGEEPAQVGQWISINLRGHLDIHEENPKGWISLGDKTTVNEILAGAAFLILTITIFVIMLAM